MLYGILALKAKLEVLSFSVTFKNKASCCSPEASNDLLGLPTYSLHCEGTDLTDQFR